MGNHRIHFKAEIEMHGVKDTCAMWLNWSPNGDYGGIDQRIAEWILGNVIKAMSAHWDAECAEEERKEREELARLKAKYDDNKEII